MYMKVATALLVAGPTLSDLVDTWTDSVCIHQLMLKPRSKAAWVMQAAVYNSFQLVHSSSQDTLRIGYTSLFTR